MGRAIARGPHMPMQCRLLTMPKLSPPMIHASNMIIFPKVFLRNSILHQPAIQFWPDICLCPAAQVESVAVPPDSVESEKSDREIDRMRSKAKGCRLLYVLSFLPASEATDSRPAKLIALAHSAHLLFFYHQSLAGN